MQQLGIAHLSAEYISRTTQVSCHTLKHSARTVKYAFGSAAAGKRHG